MAAGAQTYVARKRNIRISPRKLRLAADLIRGKSVGQATEILQFSVTKSARVMGKVLASALNNAEQGHADLDSLTVASVNVNNGIVLKRRKASGRGRMRGIYHRFSHVDLLLSEPGAKPAAGQAKPAAKAGEAGHEDSAEAAEATEAGATGAGDGKGGGKD